MGNVQEYLKKQYPYLVRMQRAIDEIISRKEDFRNTPLTTSFEFMEVSVDVLRDAQGLIEVYAEFVQGLQEKAKLYGYTFTDYDAIQKDFENAPEHKVHTISFGIN